MKRNKQSLNHKVSIAVIFAVLLILASPLMAATVNVDLNTTNQTIRGFGGMNFPRWIGTLTDTQVDKAFGNGPGQIGFTIMRIDVPPSSSSWSGEVSAAVRAKSHGAIIFASPWSPPASMKTNGSTELGSLEVSSYGDYADYLSEFADYMSSNGASLYAISLQNEADFLPNPPYESCLWTPSEMRTFLDNNAFVIPVRVIAAETVHYKSSWYNTLSSASELDIYADHLYGGIPTSVSKEHWMTEHLDENTDWESVLATGKEIHDCMANNYSAYIWWYIRRSYGPIDESGNVTKRGYVMSQYAKFVRPGYIRVNATANPSSGVYVTAYKTDDTLVIVAVNQNSYSSDVTFSLSGGSVSSYTKYVTTSSSNLSNLGSVGSTNTLDASSITTFVGAIDGGDTTPPSAPTGFDATGENLQVSLDWEDNEEIDLVGYNVYRSTTSGSDYDQINGSFVTSSDYIDDTVTPEITYYYVVTAVDDNDNESDYSSEDSATPYDADPPAAPTGLISQAGNSTVSLDWLDNVEEDVNGYNVYRSQTSGSGYVKLNDSLVSSSDYIDDTVSNQTTYYYVVTAVDIYSNESGYSGEVPATPSSITPTIYNFDGITASNTEYNAFACDVDTFPFGGSSANVNSKTEATDEEYVNISTNNSAEWATADAGFFDQIFLWVEMKINETPGDISRIDLTFNGNTSGTADVIHRIYVMKAGADWTQNNSWVQVGSDMSISPGVDTTMTRSISSDFGTYIDDSNGKLIWAVYETTSSEVMHINYLETSVTGNGDTEPPAAPTGLVATAGNDLVSLDWSDNSETDLAGYNVYRSQTGGSGYNKINSLLLADSNYVDNDVDNFTTYYYVVTAVDTNNNGSGYSNEASATPDIYQNCAEVRMGGDGLVSDLTGDCYVNLEDLDIVTGYWLNTNCGSSGNCGGADFEPVDGDVDLEDFSDFAVDWLLCNNPVDSGCIRNW